MPDLRRTSPRRALWQLGAPTAAGYAFVFAVDLVDLWAAGRLGTSAVAALGWLAPLTVALTAMGAGLGNATTVRVATALGTGPVRSARAPLKVALFVAVGLGLGVAVCGAGLTGPVLAHWSGPVAVGGPLASWLGVGWWGVPLLFGGLAGAGGLRAWGDARAAAGVLLGVALLNAVLTPLFAFGLELGLAGVAGATVLARGAGLVWTLHLLERRGLLGRGVSLQRDAVEGLVRLATPMVATKLAWPAALAALTALVAQHGVAATAAFAIACRLEVLLMVPVAAVASALTPLVAQCRTDPARLRDATRIAARCTAAWGLVAWGGLAALGPLVLPLWTLEPEVMALAQLQLWIVGAGWWAHGWASVAGAGLAAVGRPRLGTALVTLRGFAVAVPLGALLGASLGPGGVYWAMATGSVVVGALGRVLLRRHIAARADAGVPCPPLSPRSAPRVQGGGGLRSVAALPVDAR